MNRIRAAATLLCVMLSGCSTGVMIDTALTAPFPSGTYDSSHCERRSAQRSRPSSEPQGYRAKLRRN